MGERLQMLLQHLGLNSARFADLVDIQPSAVSHLISGRNKPGFDLLSKILARYPELNPRWLILGEGEMFNSAPTVTARESHIFPEQDTAVDLIDSPEVKTLSIDEGFFPDRDKESVNEPATDSTSPDITPVPEHSAEPANNNDQIIHTGKPVSPGIKSVIIFYNDGTFESFNHK